MKWIELEGNFGGEGSNKGRECFLSRGTDVKISNDDLSRKARYEARNV